MHLMTLNTVGQKLSKPLQYLSGLPALAMRLVLAPVFIVAGYNMLQMSSPGTPWTHWLLPQPDIIVWFGNTSWGLGFPAPAMLAALAAWTQFFGGWLILVGLLTRLAALPAIITMAVAIISVHWQYGWFAVQPESAQTSPAQLAAWFGVPAAQQSLDNSRLVARKLSTLRGLVVRYGHPEKMYEQGELAIYKNGMEMPVIYLIMLFNLLIYGGGRFVSMDYYLFPKIAAKE